MMLVSTRATPWFSRNSWILLILLNSDSTVVRLVLRSITWLIPCRGPTRRVVADCFSSWCPNVVVIVHRKKGRGSGERRQEEEIENTHWVGPAGSLKAFGWGSVPEWEDNIEGKMVWDAPVFRAGLDHQSK